MVARNPSWAQDELILALDLYLREGMLDDTDPKVIELSGVLNDLPIHTVRPDLDRFRNPNGVALKLANFAALDPAYPGIGMRRHGQRDAQVWDLFSNRRDEVSRLASIIRAGATSGAFPAAPEEDEEQADEGRLLYRQHRQRERDRTLVSRKKARAKNLDCEVCGFNFERRYGPLGQGYIECHHVIPLSESGRTTTRLTDLVLICANCHRMAHRRKPWPSSIEGLRALLEEDVGVGQHHVLY